MKKRVLAFVAVCVFGLQGSTSDSQGMVHKIHAVCSSVIGTLSKAAHRFKDHCCTIPSADPTSNVLVNPNVVIDDEAENNDIPTDNQMDDQESKRANYDQNSILEDLE